MLLMMMMMMMMMNVFAWTLLFMSGPQGVAVVAFTSSSSSYGIRQPRHPTNIITTTTTVLRYGLYEVQEDMLTKRAKLEESLMSNAVTTPLLANKPKGSGSSGGFGGGSGAKKKKNLKKTKVNPQIQQKQSSSSTSSLSQSLLMQQGMSHAQVVRDNGVVRIDHVLSMDQADDMRNFVLEYRTMANQQVESNEIPIKHRFADVLLRKNRSDLTMPFNEMTYRMLHQVLCQSSIGTTMETLLGKNTILQEFSCLISDPGSDRQVMHPDTPFLEKSVDTNDDDDDGPIVCTCFIALQDITPDMGPTVWLPQTHTREIHAQFMDESSISDDDESPKDALLRNRPIVLGTLTKGSCAIYDSRVLHCGTANRSQTPRALFYVSFRKPNIYATGNPPSIRPELQGKLSLHQLQQQLESWSQGKGCPELDTIAKTMI